MVQLDPTAPVAPTDEAALRAQARAAWLRRAARETRRRAADQGSSGMSLRRHAAYFERRADEIASAVPDDPHGVVREEAR